MANTYSEVAMGMTKQIPPPLACLLHYVGVMAVSVAFHDLQLGHHSTAWHKQYPEEHALMRRSLGAFFGLYAIWLLVVRLVTAQSKVTTMAAAQSLSSPPQKEATVHPSGRSAVFHCTRKVYTTDQPVAMVWYEFTWLCNVTLVMSAYALGTDRIVLAWAHGVVVAIDQLMWYVDGVVYLTSGRMLIGVFRHIFQPHLRKWYHHLTAWHHLWTMPLLVIASQGAMPSGITTDVLQRQQHQQQDRSTFGSLYWAHFYPTWLLSVVIMTTNVLSTRLLTPYALVIRTSTTDTTGASRDYFHYLNVNLSYEVWKDLSKSITYLRIQDDYPSMPIYLLRLLVRWMLLNSCIWGVVVLIAMVS